MHVAITGSNGFIGRHLVHRAADLGWRATPVMRGDYESNALPARFAGADVVIHAAGATRAPTRAGLIAANVDLTARTLDAARQAGVRRFVFISSQAAAGPATSHSEPRTESQPERAVEAYGRSKLEAERLVGASDIPWVVLRPSAVYGPYDRDFLALFRLGSRGVAIHPGNRDQWISIIHVHDLARAVMLAAADTNAVSETFFLCNDAPVQWSTLYDLVAKRAGRRVKLDLQIPPAAVSLAAKGGDVIARLTGRAGLLTTEKVALAQAGDWVCSNARARAMLGFVANVEVERGVSETYDWYRAKEWL